MESEQEIKREENNRWMILAVSILGILMVMVHLNVASAIFTEISADFVVDAYDVRWSVYVYLFFMGTLQTLADNVCNYFGLKRTYLGSLMLFIVGCALCGISWNFTSLVIFRCIQGIGGGIFLNAAMLTIMNSFPPRQLKLPMALCSMMISLGPVISPVVGGGSPKR